MDREELKAIVAQMLRELAPAQTPPSPPPVKGAETAPEAPPDDGVLPDLTTVDLRAQYLVPNAAHGAEFRALKAKTPARLGLGRCGARYPTASLLRFRADHAAALAFLQNGPRFREAENGVFYLAHCAARTGTYLSRAAHIPAGQPLAYLIAPPVPALLGLDAALKAAGVELAEFYAPPTETNFAGALLTGTRSACLAACTAFAEAVCEAAARPLEAEGTRRNDHGI